MNFAFRFVFVGALCLTLVVLSAMGSTPPQVDLTAKEIKALEKFKNIVIPRIPPSSYLQNYQNDDLFFIRWLRAQYLNVDAAVQMFDKHLQWRAKEKIDTIDQEDWSKYKKEYPFFDDTVDKEGRPAAEFWLPFYNTRQAVFDRDGKTLLRWMVRTLELLQRRLYSARAEGKQISHGIVLLTLKDFDLVRQGCLACLPIYVGIVALYENNYPEMVKNFYFVDMPRSFQIILSTAVPFMRSRTQKSLKFYSSLSRTDWMTELDAAFDKSERSTLFGGTIVRDLT